MAMQQVTIRADADLIERLDEEAEEQDMSRSEYLRYVLRGRHEVPALHDRIAEISAEKEALAEELREAKAAHEEERAALREQIADLEAEIEDLEATLDEREETIEELEWQLDVEDRKQFDRWQMELFARIETLEEHIEGLGDQMDTTTDATVQLARAIEDEWRDDAATDQEATSDTGPTSDGDPPEGQVTMDQLLNYQTASDSE